MFARFLATYARALFVTGLIAATSFTSASAGQASQSQNASSTHRAQLAENYGRLPLSFEANSGQADRSVKFLSRGSGYRLYLTGNEAVLTLRRNAATSSGPVDQLRMQLAGASTVTRPLGEEQLPGVANYFIGSDPAGWHTNIPTFAKVRYAGVYPGIDLVYYGNQRQLEYDFAIAPGADPAAIHLRLTGAKQLHVAKNGDLVVELGNGTLAFEKPLVYQVVDGHRQPVAGTFALLGKHTVGFRLGSYDRARPLVIDPVLQYSTYLGGSAGAQANAIAVDTAGNAYVAGNTGSTDFPVTPGAFQSTNKAAANGLGTVFVTKLNSSGTALVYSTYLGGSGQSINGGDVANGIAVDSSGNAYVTGSTYSADFPVTQGAFQTTNKEAAANGNTNGFDSTGFVTKLNATGTALVYSTYLGGSGAIPGGSILWGDRGDGLTVDSSGDAYVTGVTYSPDFPVTQGAFQTTNSGQSVFVSKLNPTGTALVYSTFLGSIGTGQGFGSLMALAVDSSGDAYVTGGTAETNFPVTPGVFQATNHNVPDNGHTEANAFVSKLNPAGTALIYSTYLGGSNADAGDAIAVDAAGNAYIGGAATSTDFPVTPGAFQAKNRYGFNDGGPSSATGANAFITKMNPTGTALVYSTYLGGSGGVVNLSPTLMMAAGDQVKGIAVDSAGNAYVTGSAASPNFPVTSGAYQTTNNDQTANSIGGFNAFVTELNPTGTALVYSTYLGGNGINQGSFTGPTVFGSGDWANALALDSSGNAYLTGIASSADFPVTGGAFQTTIPSLASAFITKMELGVASTTTTPTVTVSPTPSTTTSNKPLTVTITVSGASGAATPTGTVTLASGAYSSGAITLSGGSATVDIAAGVLAAFFCYPGPVPDILTVNYVPDSASSSTYNFSSGVGLVYLVGPCLTVTPAATNLTWAQSQSQALSVAITNATGGPANPAPTGTVTLTTGSYTSAAIALVGGNASFSIPAGTLTTGFNILNVSYSGDSNYTALPLAGDALVTVGPAGGVTMTVTPASLNVTTAQTLPVAITVSAGAGSPTPTGMVTLITSGNYISATTPLSGGAATITLPSGALFPGVNDLVVDYGDGNYAGTSGEAMVTATGPVLAYITVEPVAASIQSTQSLQVSVWVHTAVVGGTLATGTVTLSSGSYTSAATALTNAIAQVILPAGTLAPGVDTLQAVYADGNFPGTTGQGSVTVTSPPPTTSFTVAGTAVTVAPGATTGNTSTITVTPANGFTGSVVLTAALSPTTGIPPTLSFGSTTPVSITGTSAGTATLTVTTTGSISGGGCTAMNEGQRGFPWYAGGGAVLACLFLCGIPARRRRLRAMLGMLMLLVALAGGVLACGSGGRTCPVVPAGTTPGTYTVTVTGTSGTETATGTFTLTVQ